MAYSLGRRQGRRVRPSRVLRRNSNSQQDSSLSKKPRPALFGLGQKHFERHVREGLVPGWDPRTFPAPPYSHRLRVPLRTPADIRAELDARRLPYSDDRLDDASFASGMAKTFQESHPGLRPRPRVKPPEGEVLFQIAAFEHRGEDESRWEAARRMAGIWLTDIVQETEVARSTLSRQGAKKGASRKRRRSATAHEVRIERAMCFGEACKVDWEWVLSGGPGGPTWLAPWQNARRTVVEVFRQVRPDGNPAWRESVLFAFMSEHAHEQLRDLGREKYLRLFGHLPYFLTMCLALEQAGWSNVVLSDTQKSTKA